VCRLLLRNKLHLQIFHVYNFQFGAFILRARVYKYQYTMRIILRASIEFQYHPISLFGDICFCMESRLNDYHF